MLGTATNPAADIETSDREVTMTSHNQTQKLCHRSPGGFLEGRSLSLADYVRVMGPADRAPATGAC